MTTRLECSDLGYSCDWTTADADSDQVLDDTLVHLRAKHRVDTDSPALRTYVEGYAKDNRDTTDSATRGTHPAPLELVAKHYRRVAMAGRVSIILVSIAALSMLALLYRTQAHAAGIKDKSALIAQSGRGINEYTDSLLQLNKTNELTGEMRDSLIPLNRDLRQISLLSGVTATNLASIKSSSLSIEGSSNSIDVNTRAIGRHVQDLANTIPAINTSLQGINANAAQIFATAQSLAAGINLIGSNLTATAKFATQVLHDARGIRTRLNTTNHYASCVDDGLNGGSDC